MKLKPPFTGTLKVIRLKGNGVSVQLEVPASWQASDTWHISWVKKYDPFVWGTEGGKSEQRLVPPEEILPGEEEVKGFAPVWQQEVLPVPEDVVLVGSHDQYKVLAILDQRVKKGVTTYRLRFRDKSASEDVWCEANEAQGKYAEFEAALAEFKAKHRLRDRRR